MSDHSDAQDPRTDITDLYVFREPSDSTRSILIMNVNPEPRTPADTVDPGASYELKIDTNGDAYADIAYHVLFAASDGELQTATVYRVAGEAAERSGSIGDVVLEKALVSLDGNVKIAEQGGYRFYAGLRSDPWFADVSGFFDDFRFSGRDTFADRNVFAIVLEVPHEALNGGRPVGVWAQTVALLGGSETVMDRAGHPLINALFNTTPEDQHAFNRTPPSQQREYYASRFTAALAGYGYSEIEAAARAAALLPDVLPYDPASAPGYPNGRLPTDDVLDLRLALITRQRVTTDHVGPHADLLPDFPYLGPSHQE